MAKDTIFENEPPRVQRVKTHMRLHGTIEQMKNFIRSASTIQQALDILMNLYSRDYIIFIKAAIREVFQ
jgi:hypothetical protein